MKQKLYGIILLFIGILTPFFLDGDVTFSILIIPLGLYIILTKENIFLENIKEDL